MNIYENSSQHCTLFYIFRFTKKKFERESREKNDAGGNQTMTLLAGLRQFHESEPELKRTISGHLNEMIETEEPTVRRNIAFFGAAGPAIVQVTLSGFQSKESVEKSKLNQYSPLTLFITLIKKNNFF